MICLACKSQVTEYKDTVISGFLAERIFGKTEKEPIPVKLFHCSNCGFAFYDKRLSDAEAAKLYSGYRSEEYQKQRRKHDIWYTPEINEAIGGKSNIEIRCKYMSDFLKREISVPITNALDFGGDKGQFFPDDIPISNKYVYDISGIETVPGVIGISSLSEAHKKQYDFIMCNHVLEHISDFDETLNEIKSLGNPNTLFYFELPFDTPFIGSIFDNIRFIGNPYYSFSTLLRHLFKTLHSRNFAPMTEHINYFTPEALNAMLNLHGFKTIKNNTEELDFGWNKEKVISALCVFKDNQ